MIFVDRTQVIAPVILTQPGLAGLRESARAIANFRTGGPCAKFTYSVYSDDTVKEALIKLFNKKCAYCETIVTTVYYGDVEHFRPKSQIAEAIPPIAPGYYWLGSDWDNLLFACKLCNSAKILKIYGSTVVEALGKMDQFPLYNFNHIRDHTFGIASEEPHRLLINPCKEDPEILISYGSDGNILPKRSLTGFLRLKVDKSIRVYALQRMDLVDERKKLRLSIEMQQERVLDNTKNFLRFIDSNPELAAEFEASALREMRELKKYCDPKMPYSGMAREMVSYFLMREYGQALARTF